MATIDNQTSLTGANVSTTDIVYVGIPGDADPDRKMTVAELRKGIAQSGTTANRVSTTVVGTMYFDTTLGQPIWWDGSQWVDATGTAA